MLTRRLLLAAALFAPLLSRAQGATAIEVWKTPGCGCCGGWLDHLRESGFQVTAHDVADTAPIRRRAGVAPQFASCHTGLVGGYAIEGHVAAQDIRRLLSEKPQAAGLAVPGMPVGTPGMDEPVYGGRRDPHEVLLIQANGQSSVWRTVS